MKRTESLNIRITPDTRKQLDELAELWNITITQVVDRLIYAEWCKSTKVGQKKIKEVMETLGTFKRQFEELTNGEK